MGERRIIPMRKSLSKKSKKVISVSLGNQESYNGCPKDPAERMRRGR
jgi:hypothetical protein